MAEWSVTIGRSAWTERPAEFGRRKPRARVHFQMALVTLALAALFAGTPAPAARGDDTGGGGGAPDSIGAGEAARPDSGVATCVPVQPGAVALDESLKTYALREILVTATRLPSRQPLYFSNVAIASQTDLAELASSTVAEALTTDSGVELTHYGSYGSLQTVSLRGAGSSEVAYLLDGVPISDPQIAAIDLNWLPLSGTSRVEAMKGGASSLYGSGAMGGAVNLVSMDAMPEVPSSNVTWWTGSFGSKAADVVLRRSLAGRAGVLAAYDYFKSGGWITNSAYRGDKYYGKATAQLGTDSRLDMVSFRYAGNIQVPGTFPGTERDHRKFYKVALSSTDDQGFSAAYYHSTSDETFTSTGDIYGQDVYRHSGIVDGLDLEIYSRKAESEATTFGIGLERKRMDSNSAGKRSASDVYGFFQKEASQGPLRLSGSVRLEKNSQFEVEAAPQLTAWYSAGRGFSIFSKLDRSFMYPSFDDLYWKGPNEQGDPSLRTEHSAGSEAGLHFDSKFLETSLAAYYRDVDDMILWRTDSTCLPTKSTNASVHQRGLEASLTLRPASGVQTLLSYSIERTTDETGKQLAYKPSSIFAWTVKAERPFSKHTSGGLVFSGRNLPRVNSGDQYDYAAMTCLHDTSLPGYGSALVYAYFSIDRAKIFVRVPNLFNAHIYPSWGMPRLPGRSYEAGIAWNLLD